MRRSPRWAATSPPTPVAGSAAPATPWWRTRAWPPLGNHGGPTQTHPRLPGSPAIDTALVAPCSATDQRGMPRPQDGNADVAVDSFARGAIEALYANGITSGCGTSPLVFCPDGPVTRAQLSVFLLRTLHGSGFTPPPAIGIFADVPIGDSFAPWIEEFFRRGVTSGCQLAPPEYCPADPATRAQIAVFLVRAFGFGF